MRGRGQEPMNTHTAHTHTPPPPPSPQQQQQQQQFGGEGRGRGHENTHTHTHIHTHTHTQHNTHIYTPPPPLVGERGREGGRCCRRKVTEMGCIWRVTDSNVAEQQQTVTLVPPAVSSWRCQKPLSYMSVVDLFSLVVP